MNDLISIIMPVYKVEHELLENAFQSVLRQSYENIELIAIDDGSPDDCGSICDEYRKKDARVRVVHTGNKGVSSARNTGISAAEGKFVMFVDSDDYIDRDLVENLYHVMHKHEADCVICGCVKTQRTDDPPKQNNSDFGMKVFNSQEITNALFYMEQPFEGFELTAVWGTLYRKSVIEGLQFNTKMKIGEDFEFRYQLFKKINKVVCVNLCGYHYLIRESSAMRNGFDPCKLDAIAELEKMIDTPENREYRDGIISRAVNIAIVILFMIPIQPEYKNVRADVVCFLKKYRKAAASNPRTRNKVKMALRLSYLGFDNVQRIFALINK